MNKSFVELNSKLENSRYIIDSLYRQDSIRYEILQFELAKNHEFNINDKSKKTDNTINTLVLPTFISAFIISMAASTSMIR